ncbi:MAG: DUF3014 domain-containing protein [Pseudomonadota bacterium]
MMPSLKSPKTLAGRISAPLLIVLVLMFLLILAGVAYYGLQPPQSSPTEPETPSVEPGPEAMGVDASPSAPEPIGPASAVKPLVLAAEAAEAVVVDTEWPDPAAAEAIEPMALNRADREIHQQLLQPLDVDAREWLFQERLIERMVVTIHSLDRDGVPLRMRPMAHVPGLPNLDEQGDGWRFPSESDPRYQGYRALLDQLDPEFIVQLYQAYQPSFEQAWLDLGQLDNTFDERLLDVIDHLLMFDYPDSPPVLVRPEVLYEYADPALEQATAGHKLLIRIGPDHAAAVQRMLRSIRSLLTQAQLEGSVIG